jgi:hypothetical protein
MKNGISSKFFSFAALSLLFTSLSAIADQHSSPDVSLHRFDFNCRFEKNGSGSSDVDANEKLECQAVARVFAYARDYNSADDRQFWDHSNLLAIACNDELVYASSAVLDSGKKAVKIIGQASPFAAIIIPRHHDDKVDVEWMVHKAFLKVGGKVIPGQCKVRAVPLHGSHSDAPGLDEGSDDAQVSTPALR